MFPKRNKKYRGHPRRSRKTGSPPRRRDTRTGAPASPLRKRKRRKKGHKKTEPGWKTGTPTTPRRRGRLPEKRPRRLYKRRLTPRIGTESSGPAATEGNRQAARPSLPR